MIDPLAEQVIDFAEAARLIPKRRGKKVHRATLYRWAMRGCRGVRLETIQIGATKMTSREALTRFFEQLTGANSPAPPASRTERQRQKAVQEAERELVESGW